MNSRNPWTPIEDQILKSLVKKYGEGNWVLISQKMESKANTNSRSGKQCRQRWHNHLNPEVLKKTWTLQEQKIMFQAHKKYGNKWSDISKQIKGRTDSDVKNHFYSIIRKCLRRVSKMVGQKNSTQKIRNVKPSILSRLLDNNKDPKSKQTSQALFKFILQRQNLNIQKWEKKNRQLLEGLVEKIVNISQQKQQDQSSQLEQKKQKPVKQQKNAKKQQNAPRSCRTLRSSIQIKSQQLISLPQNKKKNSKIKKIKKSGSIKSIKAKKKPSIKQQKVQTLQKQNKFNSSKQLPQQQQLGFFKNPSFMLQQIMDQQLGFKYVDLNYMKRRSSISKKDSIMSQRKLNQMLLTDNIFLNKKSSGNQSQMHRMFSSHDRRIICATPPQPSPGYGQNLFPSWSLPKLSKQVYDQQTQNIKRQIQRNIKIN